MIRCSIIRWLAEHEELNNKLKFFVFTFFMSLGFWLFYSFIYYIIGLSLESWLFQTLWVPALFSTFGFCKWLQY